VWENPNNVDQRICGIIKQINNCPKAGTRGEKDHDLMDFKCSLVVVPFQPVSTWWQKTVDDASKVNAAPCTLRCERECPALDSV
jgi:hypothetical protein